MKHEYMDKNNPRITFYKSMYEWIYIIKLYAFYDLCSYISIYVIIMGHLIILILCPWREYVDTSSYTQRNIFQINRKMVYTI